MLTLLEIKTTIDEKILSILADTPFSETNIVADAEAIVRPAIMVSLEKSSEGRLNSKCKEMTLSFGIHFFAADPNQYHNDNLNMQSIIEAALLEGIYINGAYIPIDSIQSETVDTVLVCKFNLYIVELLPDTDTSEMTEELKFKEVVK